MILTVIENDALCPVDRFGPWLAEAAPVSRLQVVRAWDGEPVPTVAEAGDGLLVLGGTMHAYADDEHPWLPAVRTLLADAAAAGLPTLGICLGAQLLAVATGGRVHVGAPPGREAGLVEVHPRPDAVGDPLLGRLAHGVVADHPRAGGVLARMPSMHADAVVDLPPGATWLASSAQYPYQAFRVGDAGWGLQFHPEASPATVRVWAERSDDVDTEDVVAQVTGADDDVVTGGREIARRFAEVVAVAMAGRTPLAATRS